MVGIVIQTEKSVNSAVFSCHGVDIEFRSKQRELLLSAIEPPFLPGCTRSTNARAPLVYSLEFDRSRGEYLAYIGSQRIVQGAALDRVLNFIQSHAGHAIAENAVGRLFVHAGVVGWRGKAILIPGRSHAGKSMLVREFVRQGATYLSDEFAILDSSALVYPFPQPLSLRTADGKVSCSLKELGSAVATEPLKVGMVLFTTYRPDAVFQPVPLSEGLAILEFLKHVVAVRRCPASALKAARSVMSGSPALYAERGEAHQVPAALLSQMTIL
jgi:hypothetical protein